MFIYTMYRYFRNGILGPIGIFLKPEKVLNLTSQDLIIIIIIFVSFILL